jgi:conjugal transfer/entry exclusion protein
MKAIFILIGSLFFTAAARGQWVVYDPAVHTQQILDQAQNIAKYVEMVNNQIQQINTLTSQLQELEKYNEAFGNPAKLLNITGVNGLVRDLRKTELGQRPND